MIVRSPRRPWVIGCVVLAMACSGAGEARGDRPASPAQRPAARSMLVMTYNLNYGVAGDRDTIELIRSSDADVVLLQETNPSWEKALREALADRYAHMAFHHSERRAGGLAFLSRHPLSPDRPQESPIGWFPAWRALVDTPLGRIQLVNLHLRPPGRRQGGIVRSYFASQEERLDETRAHVRLIDPSLPAVVAGDFNEDARGRSLLFLAKRGLESALERFHPFTPTWRWQTRMGLVRWQLDHILVGPALRASAAWVLDGGASDHVPVLARVERSAP